MIKDNRKIFIILVLVTIVSIGVSALINSRSRNIRVISVFPSANSNLDSISFHIEIGFADLTDKDKEFISVINQPKNDLNGEWIGDTLILTPKDLWEVDQTYQFKVLFGSKQLAEFQYTTPSAIDLNEEDKLLLETQNKENLQNSYLDFIEKNPWLDKLPIITNNFIIVYDYENPKIRVRILNTDGLHPEELNSLENKALVELNKINVPETITIEFIYD